MDRASSAGGFARGEPASGATKSSEALAPAGKAAPPQGAGGEQSVATIADDRDTILPGDKALLIIEDDINFANILLDRAREEGFKGLIALSGQDGLEMAHQYGPDAISLDLRLSGIDGWTVLDRLKRDPRTRHIPVQVVSVLDRDEGVASVGAIAYLEKPVTTEALRGAFAHLHRFLDRGVRDLLIVEDDEVQRVSLVELLAGSAGEDGASDVATVAVATGEEALAAMSDHSFDCMVLDLSLPGMSGLELLKQVKADARWGNLPVVIYTGRNLSRQEESQIKRYAASIITKDVGSADRLMDETAMFLHQVVARMPESKQRIIEQRRSLPTEPPTVATKLARRKAKEVSIPVTVTVTRPTENGSGGGSAPEADLAGRTVLVVDDDVRNIFALTSMLEAYGMTVVFAENGRDGIETFQSRPEIEAILMDIMMPEMDGYETMQRIRSLPGGRGGSLPIIALTAKAMAGDREKCLEAGASDYIPKPVDVDQLLQMLRQWIGVGAAAAR
ncbi:MAG: response regulator [Cytophagales bacterium]|nr:response regulator [Armatimonadota bacterium]